jgi:hypothetical protein
MNEELTGKCLRPVVTFGLTRPVLEPMIYHTRGEHDNQYATDVVVSVTSEKWFDLIWFLVFNATFSNYIMATSFSGGRSRREPPTMGKQLVSLITCGCESSAPFL